MNINLANYITNKDITLTNDDVDMDRLQKDVYKGYVKQADVNAQLKDKVDKSEYTKLQQEYTTLESENNNLTKKLADTNDKMEKVSFDSILSRRGIAQDNLDEIYNMRKSMYADVQDDNEAVDKIMDKFGSVYLPKQNAGKVDTGFTPAPNEGSMGAKEEAPKRVAITRNTSIHDLLIPSSK